MIFKKECPCKSCVLSKYSKNNNYCTKECDARISWDDYLIGLTDDVLSAPDVNIDDVNFFDCFDNRGNVASKKYVDIHAAKYRQCYEQLNYRTEHAMWFDLFVVKRKSYSKIHNLLLKINENIGYNGIRHRIAKCGVKREVVL